MSQLLIAAGLAFSPALIRWNIQPEALQLGPVILRWYGILFALTFAFGYLMVRWQFRMEGKNEETLGSLLAYVVISAIAGARLGHCLFYEPQYYLAHPLEILAVWRGGLASHGGVAGILIGVALYARRHPDQPYLWLLDRIVVPTALGGAFIRLGNLFNSEILGKPAEVPWAFVFERVDQVPRHPVQLYEAASYALIFAGLAAWYRVKRGETAPGLLLGVFLGAVFTARIALEPFKVPQTEYRLPVPLSVGQLLSVPLVLVGLVLIWRSRARARPSPDSRPAG